MIFTQQSKPIESPNIADIESVTIEHPKTSRKLSKTTRQGKNVPQIVDAGKSSNSPLYSDTKKPKVFLNEKNVKITKRSHAYKSYASSSNVDILNSFNPEFQLKDTKSVIKNNLKTYCRN